jgi:hypothetical protein
MNTIDEMSRPSDAEGNRRRVRVLSQVGEMSLDAAVAGADFIAGFATGGLVAVPTATIRELGEGEPPQGTSGGLLDLLARQRQPVRIVTATDKYWLLNVQAPWIRVAARSGTLWLPATAICLVEFGAVDNQKLAV